MSRSNLVILADLPSLVALLPVAGSHPDTVKVAPPPPGPRPPTRLDVLQILDVRRRSSADPVARSVIDEVMGDHRQGVLPDLAQWAALIHSGMVSAQVATTAPPPGFAALCAWLARHDGWISEQPYSREYRHDLCHWDALVRQVHGLVEERDMAHACSRCGNPAELVNDGDLWTCAACHHEDPGPAQQIRTFRFQPSQPTPVICEMFGIDRAWLYRHKHRRGLVADSSKGADPLHWWPWDVFALLNPGIVEIWETRQARIATLTR